MVLGHADSVLGEELLVILVEVDALLVLMVYVIESVAEVEETICSVVEERPVLPLSVLFVVTTDPVDESVWMTGRPVIEADANDPTDIALA